MRSFPGYEGVCIIGHGAFALLDGLSGGRFAGVMRSFSCWLGELGHRWKAKGQYSRGVSVGVCGVPYLGLGGRSLRAGTREVSCVSAKGEGGGLWCGVM